jgi:predicted nucleic acid-binding protein
VVTNKSGSGLVYRKTVFLDTNYIGFLSLFFKLCTTVGRKLTDTSVLDSKILAKCGIKKKKLEIGILRKGKKLFDYLLAEAQQGSDIVTSRFCELEFIHLLLERQADENLLQAGVPFRLRTKRQDTLYLTNLEPGDYAKISSEYEQLLAELSEYGIEMRILEEMGKDYEQQIIEIAKLLMGSIMIGAPDAFIYAAAVVAEADELLTNDDAFRDVANYLRNPGEERWKIIASSFMDKLNEQSISKGEDSERIPFVLPLGKQI